MLAGILDTSEFASGGRVYKYVPSSSFPVTSGQTRNKDLDGHQLTSLERKGRRFGFMLCIAAKVSIWFTMHVHVSYSNKTTV
jgi:hypothetical protein